MINLEILDLMGQINRACQAALQQSGTLKDLDIPAFSARMLSVISRNPARTQQELSVMLERDRAQVTRTIRDLESRGLVTRIAHETDWRAQCPVVTEEGERIASLLNQERVDLADRMMRGLAGPGQQELIAMLKQMLNDLTPPGEENQVP